MKLNRRFAFLTALLLSTACSDTAEKPETHTPGDKLPMLPSQPSTMTPGTSGSGGSSAMPTTPSTPVTPSQPATPNGGAGGSGAMTPAMTAGSGGNAMSAAGSSAAAGAGAGGTSAVASGDTVLKITAHAIPPAGENHICVVLPLPNDAKAYITSIHATLTAGSHHLIVDRRPAGSALQMTEAPCPPTQGSDGTRLMIAQQRDTVLNMPAGTALAVEPHQPVFLQLHYINLDTKTVDIEGAIDVTFADPASTPPTEVQSIFTGATSLSIPAGQDALGEFFFKPGMADKPWHVFAITSHTHSLGIESTIERVANRNAPDVTPLHDSMDWHEPPLTTFDPPLMFDGSDGLRLRCHYHNDTDHDVSFGTRFEDEMCFLWLYYY